MLRDITDHHHLKSMIFANPIEKIIESIKLPEPIYKTHTVQRSRMLRIADQHVDSTVKRMLQAGDVGGALQHLGGKSTDNIMDVLKNRLKNSITR